MIKPALIALALLTTPAAAETIIFNYDLDFLPIYYPWYYQELVTIGAYGYVPGCDPAFCTPNGYVYSPVHFTVAEEGFHAMFPPGTEFVYGAVPEPATWAMLLLGFVVLSVAAPSRRRSRRPSPAAR